MCACNQEEFPAVNIYHLCYCPRCPRKLIYKKSVNFCTHTLIPILFSLSKPPSTSSRLIPDHVSFPDLFQVPLLTSHHQFLTLWIYHERASPAARYFFCCCSRSARFGASSVHHNPNFKQSIKHQLSGQNHPRIRNGRIQQLTSRWQCFSYLRCTKTN